jgi:hypothetical protein
VSDHPASLTFAPGPPTYWHSLAFPVVNIEFIVMVDGRPFTAHVKWRDRPEPYAMSLKPFANVMQGDHPALWAALGAQAALLRASYPPPPGEDLPAPAPAAPPVAAPPPTAASTAPAPPPSGATGGSGGSV